MPTADPAVVTPPVLLPGEYLVVVLPIVGSEAGPSHLERLTVAEDGTLTTTTVLEVADFDLTNAYINSWRNIHHPPPATGPAVIVSLCHEAQCGGLDFADSDARTTLIRTLDGGTAWEELATLDGAYWVHSWNSEGSEVLLREYPSDASRPLRTVRWPSMAEVVPLATGSHEVLAHQWPFFLPDGEIAWWTNHGLVDETGRLVLDFAELTDEQLQSPLEVSLSPDGERLVLTWAEREQSRPWFWTLFELTDAGTYEPVRTLRQPNELGIAAVPYSWIDSDRVVVPAGLTPASLGLPQDLWAGYIPTVIDFSTAEVSPVAAFATPELASRGNLVIGVR